MFHVICLRDPCVRFLLNGYFDLNLIRVMDDVDVSIVGVEEEDRPRLLEASLDQWTFLVHHFLV